MLCMPRWTHSESERTNQTKTFVGNSKGKFNCVKRGYTFQSVWMRALPQHSVELTQCSTESVPIIISFFSKCTSTFHAAFTCPIQMITSKESSVCFFMLVFFSFYCSVLFSFIFVKWGPAIYFSFPVFMSSIMLSVVWQSLLLAKTKCDSKFDWARYENKDKIGG